MTRFAVQRCVGNDIEVLGVYESKEEMLQALEKLKTQYDGKTGVINGISGNLGESGLHSPGEIYRLY